ncbi:SusC/RagA family TonB-linked outer membrane protein [Parapedobacter soli]|uniref:SusC/RagA family TonB-linked outer membrane protein n=1 Tax=Parapedobacter soli TaxID=416955 RepID=UPI0021C62BFA|nr:TonB-dependent receptor [Parapedobacter soli]
MKKVLIGILMLSVFLSSNPTFGGTACMSNDWHLFAAIHGVDYELTIENSKVEGTVVSSDGRPLFGVNVLIKGTSRGTITDSEGKFSLEIIGERATLVISHTGYQTQEVLVDGGAHIAVTLQAGSPILDEVVVVGYGTQKRVNLTGAVEQIGSEYLENRPVPNLSRALQGLIPNLNIRHSNGRPTASPALNVRGLTSIGAGGEALILIDGIPGHPETINPNDIESVAVLKDAASAAIYGSRGAFGVILITTKNPKNAKPQITYSGNYSFNSRTENRKYVTDPYIRVKFGYEAINAFYDGDYLPAELGSSYVPFSLSYLDELKYRYENPDQDFEVVEVDPVTGRYMYFGNHDWEKEYFNSSIPSTEHSITVSGKGENTHYLISANYFGQDGLYKIRSDKFNRYNLRIKGGLEVTDWLAINTNTSMNRRDYFDPFNLEGYNMFYQLNATNVPVMEIFNPDGTFTRGAIVDGRGLGSLYGEGGIWSAYNMVQQDISFIGKLMGEKLRIRGDFSYRGIYGKVTKKRISQPYSIRPNETIDSGISELSEERTTNDYFSSNVYAEYQSTFGKHDLKVLLGGNYETTLNKSLYVFRDNLIVPALDDFNLAVGDNSVIRGGGNQWATAGVFSRINYNYNERYLLEVNSRLDGSSKFPHSQQYSFFPSISVGWRVSEEAFLKNKVSWMDNLKIRASYGSLGNSQIAPYLFLEQIGTGFARNIILNGKQTAYTSSPSVIPESLTWETATTINGGLDMNLFRNRFSFSLDLYKRKTSDMITSGPALPLVFGAGVPRGNFADLETKGFELSLGWNDQTHLAGRPLSYNLRFILSDNVSTITKFNNVSDVISINTSTFQTNLYEGLRYGDIWGLVTEGIFESPQDIESSADHSEVQYSLGNIVTPGDVKFKDLNGDGKISKGNQTLSDHGDWKIIGNSTPRYSYGFNGSVNWNNFSVSIFVQGVGKRDWYPGNGAVNFWGPLAGSSYAIFPEFLYDDFWTPDNTDSYFPQIKFAGVTPTRQLQPQTRYLQNASYVRLKDLTVMYNIPNSTLSPFGIQNLSIFVSGQNIWTYSPMFKITKGFVDPEFIETSEVQFQGNDYPILKTYTIGIKISL